MDSKLEAFHYSSCFITNSRNFKSSCWQKAQVVIEILEIKDHLELIRS
jgi:hypothetical protein